MFNFLFGLFNVKWIMYDFSERFLCLSNGKTIFFLSIIFVLLFFLTGIFYCQKDDADKHFEKFCKKFLQNVSIKQLRNEEEAPVQVFLVLDLPIDNRQDITGVLSKLIRQTMKKHQFNGISLRFLILCILEINCIIFCKTCV